jgi:hypothetical protein
LDWNSNNDNYDNGAAQSQEIWWAYAPNAGSYSARAQWTNLNVDDLTLSLVAFTGIDLTSPWDSTTAKTLPAGTLSGTFSTIKSNTYLLAFYGNEYYAKPTSPIPSPTVSEISAIDNGGARWYQYSHIIGGAVNTIQNNITLGWTTVDNTSLLSTTYVILDALKASGQNVPISINSISSAQKNQITNIVLYLPGNAGKLSIYANNRPVARCTNISVGAIGTYTCPWKPTTTGMNNIYATFTDSGSSTVTSTTSIVSVQVLNRTTTR